MKKTIFFLMFISLFIIGHAQSMYINDKTGNITTIVLNSLKHLSFNSGHLIVNSKSGGAQSIVLSEIKILTFTPITGLPDDAKDFLDFRLYPNPVGDFMSVELPKSNDNSVRIELLSLEGRVLYTQSGDSQTESAITINVSSLKQGLYLCRILNDNKINTQKFIKK